MQHATRILLVLATLFLTARASSAQSAGAQPEKPIYPKPVPQVELEKIDPGFSIDGRWYSDFGYLDLEQKGSTFAGTYSCCAGRIEGEILEQQIDFRWRDPIYGSGWGYFRLDSGGWQLKGVWGNEGDMGSAGAWTAVRIDRPDLAAPTRWRVETTHPSFGDIEAQATLEFAGDRVEGFLEGHYQMTARDQPYRDEIFFLIGGREVDGELRLEWQDPRSFAAGDLLLTHDGDVLRGSWKAHRTELESEIVLRPFADASSDPSP